MMIHTKPDAQISPWWELEERECERECASVSDGRGVNPDTRPQQPRL